MSAFAVAAFHDPALPRGARGVQAVVWIRAAGLGGEGVDVALRVWTPARASVTALREVAPGNADRLEGAVALDDRTLQVDAGRWLDGVHELELAIALPECGPGDELLAARIGVLAGGEQVAQALIAVTWAEAAVDGDVGPSGAEAATAPEAVDSRTAAFTRADLPTGSSAQPRHTGAGEAGAAGPCAGCGELPDDGDRFCEACGRELAAR